LASQVAILTKRLELVERGDASQECLELSEAREMTPVAPRMPAFVPNGITALQRVLKKSLASVEGTPDEICSREAMLSVLANPAVRGFILGLARTRIYDNSTLIKAFPEVEVLGYMKKLWYSLNLKVSDWLAQFVLLGATQTFRDMLDLVLCSRLLDGVSAVKWGRKSIRSFIENDRCLSSMYNDAINLLKTEVPHAVYPTSVYRESRGMCYANADTSVVEAEMSLSIRSTIKVISNVLNSSDLLGITYKPLGRCVALVDLELKPLYGKQIERYFSSRGIRLELLYLRAWERDKHIGSVEKILNDLKRLGMSRNEPLLIVGGGVITDLGGFACSLYHRSTPYIQLCTSIVAGIDAGPSPRTCCDGHGYKNIFGAYHPPVLTITDKFFWKTLHPGWIRHGISEIIKMAVMKDLTLFELVEKHGKRLVDTKFGTLTPEDSELDKDSDLIIGRALQSYVKAEYDNLWETHQLRPHAYGHTWSPGFELQAGLLHGHAIAIGMGLGAHMSFSKGWISQQERDRILNLFSALEISLYHPILEQTELLWAAQCRMIEKRGGNLCAPIPKGGIGQSGYLDQSELPREELERLIKEYHGVVSQYPRGGLGVEATLKSVGLEEVSTK